MPEARSSPRASRLAASTTKLDHLDGILFLDRVESLVDDVFRRKVYAPPQEILEA